MRPKWELQTLPPIRYVMADRATRWVVWSTVLPFTQGLCLLPMDWLKVLNAILKTTSSHRVAMGQSPLSHLGIFYFFLEVLSISLNHFIRESMICCLSISSHDKDHNSAHFRNVLFGHAENMACLASPTECK